MTVKIYHFSSVDGRYLHLDDDFAPVSPLEPDVHLIPAFATDIAPPNPPADKWPVFKDGAWTLVDYITSKPIFSILDGQLIEPVFGKTLAEMCATDVCMPTLNEHECAVYEHDHWSVVPDWRGVKLYLKSTAELVEITEPGKTPDDLNATEIARPTDEYVWANDGWVIDPAKAELFAEQRLIAAKADALARVDTYAKSLRVKIAGTSDEIEIAAWNNKLRIALAISAGTASVAEQTAFEEEISARGRGESLDSFCKKILSNATFYARAVGVIDGMKTYACDTVNAADTPEAVATVLSDMKARAEVAFSSLMSATL